MAEINNQHSNSEIISYQVSGAEKRLYHSSKEPKEGYKKIELESGKLTYHRYLDGLIGKITYVSFRDTEFGKRFGVMLKDGDTTASISLPLDNVPYRAMIEAIFNADFSKEIAIKFYPKKDGEKVYQNCFCYYPQETYQEAGKSKNKIPERLEMETRPRGKQRASGKWDFSEQEEWYYEKASELIARFEKFKLSKSTTSVKAEEKPAVKQGVDTNDDGLPF